MKLKTKLGLVVLTGTIIISVILINELKTELPNENNVNEEFTEVIQVAEWYTLNCYPGTVSNNCVVISQYQNSSDPSFGYDLYIDGKFHSEGTSIKTIPINDRYYAGFLFDEWNTTSYENGIHELQIFGEDGELITNLFVLVEN